MPPTKLTCPRPYGLFPYENDCRKFINCWQGRAHVQDCAPGTLFNAPAMVCDHPTNVYLWSPQCRGIYLASSFSLVVES